MPTYKGKKYAYTAAGKAKMKRDMAESPEGAFGEEAKSKQDRRERIAARIEKKENNSSMIRDVERKRRMAAAMRKMGLVR